jgi:hypothetical protein
LRRRGALPDGAGDPGTVWGGAEDERLRSQARRSQIGDEVVALAAGQPEIEHRHVDRLRARTSRASASDPACR